MAPVTGDDRWLLVFDGDCGFCRGSVARVLDRDRDDRILARPFQASGVLEEAGLTRGQAERAAWLVAPDGRRWSGADAAARVLRLLPGWAGAGRLLGAPPFVWIARAVYRWVADHRPLTARLTGIGCGYDRPDEPVDGTRCGGPPGPNAEGAPNDAPEGS